MTNDVVLMTNDIINDSNNGMKTKQWRRTNDNVMIVVLITNDQ